MFESIINTVTSNPVYIAILGVIVVLLVYALIKKVIKLIFSVGVILILYVIFLNYTGQDVPETVEDLRKSMSGNAEKLKNVATESIDKAKKTTKKVLQEKVEDSLEEILEN
tara:strand:- start:384 stop:716 length:333 start_codon:yes stop_codon:yes gene_type:complete